MRASLPVSRRRRSRTRSPSSRAAFAIEADVDTWDDLARAVPPGPIALLVLDTEKLLAGEPAQLAGLVGALKTASDRTASHVIFQARELPLEAEAVPRRVRRRGGAA